MPKTVDAFTSIPRPTTTPARGVAPAPDEHGAEEHREAHEPVVVPSVDDRGHDRRVQPDEGEGAHAPCLVPEQPEGRDDSEERSPWKRAGRSTDEAASFVSTADTPVKSGP